MKSHRSIKMSPIIKSVLPFCGPYTKKKSFIFQSMKIIPSVAILYIFICNTSLWTRQQEMNFFFHQFFSSSCNATAMENCHNKENFWAKREGKFKFSFPFFSSLLLKFDYCSSMLWVGYEKWDGNVDVLEWKFKVNWLFFMMLVLDLIVRFLLVYEMKMIFCVLGRFLRRD